MGRSDVLDRLMSKWRGKKVVGFEKALNDKGWEGAMELLDSAEIESAEKQIKAEGDAPTDEPSATEAVDAMAKLVSKMIEDMGATETGISGLKAAVDELSKRYTKQAEESTNEVKALKEKHATELTALETRLKAVEATVAIKPRSAVGNEASAEIGAALKDKLPASATELDPMFKELGVLKK